MAINDSMIGAAHFNGAGAGKTAKTEARSSGKHPKSSSGKPPARERKDTFEFSGRPSLTESGEEHKLGAHRRRLTKEQAETMNKNIDRINRLMGRSTPHVTVPEDEAAEAPDITSEVVTQEAAETVSVDSGVEVQEGEAAAETEEEDKANEADDETDSESSRTSVAVNVGKRMRMIAAADSPDDVQVVLQLLQQDLSECRDGLEKGWCDENEVSKVEALIELANKRMSEVAGNEEDDSGIDAFELSMLY